MSDKPWKKFERDIAALIGGGRYPANSGASLDCGPDEKHPDCQFVAQAKHVKSMSLGELSRLAAAIAGDGETRGLFGIVGVKLRQGQKATQLGLGRQPPTPTLVVMTADTFQALCVTLEGDGTR